MTSPCPSLSRRPAVVAAVVALTCLLLSSCGIKLSSQLTVDEKWAGTRVITATVPQEDITKYVTGGIEAADAAITKHMPAELTYSGSSLSGADYVGTFTLTFDSKEDYTTKVTNILAASGFSYDPDIRWENPNTALVSGVLMEESFTDRDLLGWIPDALETESVVSGENSSSVFDTSTEPKVIFAGKEYTSKSTAVDVNTVQDNGMEAVGIGISLLPDNYLETHVYMGFEYGSSNAKLNLLDDYLKDHLPEGATTSKDIPSDLYITQGRAVTFQPADIQALNAGLTKLLGTGDTALEVTTSGLGIDIKAQFSCANVCSPGIDPQVSFLVPDNWKFSYENNSGDVSLDTAMSSNLGFTTEAHTITGHASFSATAAIVLPLKELRAVTAPSLMGDINESVEFVFAKSDVDAIGLEPKEAMKAIGLSSVSTAQEGDTIVATMKVSGDAKAVTETLNKTLPGSKVTKSKVDGTFSGRYSMSILIGTPENENLIITENTVFTGEFKAPFGQKILKGMEKVKELSQPLEYVYNEDSDTSCYFAQVSLSGMQPAGFIALGIVLLMLIVLIVLSVVFRKRLAVLMKKASEKSNEAAQQARERANALNAAANAQMPGTPAPGMPPAAPGAPQAPGAPVVGSAPLAPSAPSGPAPSAPGAPQQWSQPMSPASGAAPSAGESEADFL